MKFHRPSREELSINLAPMIDVVFLLLIFFMVTTQFAREKSIVIELPDAQSQQDKSLQQSQMIVTITGDGKFYHKGKNINVHSVIDLIDFLSALPNLRDSALLIRADGEAPHRAVVLAIDAARTLNLQTFEIATVDPAN